MKVFLTSQSTLVVDGISVAFYDRRRGVMMFDSALPIEGVIKEIEYKVDYDTYECARLVKEIWHENEWYLFRFKRGLLKEVRTGSIESGKEPKRYFFS